ncbi:hypothetical protein [Xanthobacter autotrophicus]|uniref:hypothetical protein n=1 Tax=Xanthobacter autotrophicus TaxID=280 RepID=UPI0024A6EE2B|nr:hypothetical protein [Xanthobacter autotrophicus]MDI4655679.1 hypothetical protein [Xanthobacter autotrophicus]
MTPRTTAALLLPVVLFAAAPVRADGGSETRKTLNADGSVSMTYWSAVEDIGTVFGMDLSRSATSAAPVVTSGASDLGGTAYARVTLSQLPDWLLWQKGTVNVSLDPAGATGKVATTFSRTVTLASGLDATLADTYRVASGAEAWETDKSVSLKLVETGTTFSLATKATQETPALLPSVSAQQKVLGDITVTTAVADTGATLNKSITAGFTHRW